MTQNQDGATGRPHRARAAIGAVALAIIVTACSGVAAKSAATTNPQSVATNSGANQPTPDTASEGTDPVASACNLLSEADVSTAMEQKMQISGGAGAAICTYSATADPSVLLAVQSFTDHPGLYTNLEPSSEHIDGLGDDAFWNPTLDMVFVENGAGAFTVVSPSLANLVGDPQGSKAAMINLARIVLASG